MPSRRASLQVAWTISHNSRCSRQLVRVAAVSTNRVDAMELIVVDLEATCWNTSRLRNHMEIIEIGAVRLDASLTIVDEFACFVRPVVEPKLSQFCTALTTIRQADVDGADMYPAVFTRFLEWIGAGPYRLCSWGFFDVGQFRLDCPRFGLVFPEQFESDHLNIKQVFADRKCVRRCGMAAALDLLGLPLAGTHHRGIDDARNIARIVQETLPNVVDA